MVGFLEHISLVMDADSEAGNDAVSHHDAALGQGARVRRRLPARLGGRPLPLAAHARRERPRRASRRSGGSPMSASRGRASAPTSASPPTGACTACGRPRSPRASSTNCPRPMSTSRGDARLWRLRRQRLWRQPLRRARSRSPTPMRRPAGSARRRTAAARRVGQGGNARLRRPATSGPRLIEGELVAKSVIGGTIATMQSASASSTRSSATAASPRIDGNKLTIDFDKAGQKRVLDSFVERH